MLDVEDLVLLRGTPAYTTDGQFDTRILVKKNGLAIRAQWWYCDNSETSAKAEFHQWEYQIPQTKCEEIRKMLDEVAQAFADHDLTIDGNDSVDTLTFWYEDSRLTAEIHTGPPERVSQYSHRKVQAFAAVAQQLYSIVPQRTIVALDERRLDQRVG